MKCKRCQSENIVKNGLRRGKPCYFCKDCKHQFTSEKPIAPKYNDCDKYIAILLDKYYIHYKKIHPFIHTTLTTSHVAKLLGIKYSTVYYWTNVGKKRDKKIEAKQLIQYIKNRENGKDILGLLFPNKVNYKASEKLLKIVKRK